MLPIVPIGHTNKRTVLTGAYIGSTASNSNSASYSFAGQSVGAADPLRWVVVTVHSIGSSATEVTIGGVAATSIANGNTAQIWIAYLPTGTTATIDVTMSSAATCCHINVYTIGGLARPEAFSTATTGGSSPNNQSVAVAKGGYVICATRGNNNNSVSISGSGVTQNYNASMESVCWAGAASVAPTADSSSLTIIGTQSGATLGMVTASWSP